MHYVFGSPKWFNAQPTSPADSRPCMDQVTVSEDWQKLRELLEGASSLSDEERVRFLDRQCGTDSTLRKEVEKLLAARSLADGQMDRPAVEYLGETQTELSAPIPTKGTLLAKRYFLERKLGSGAFGVAYLARDEQLHGREVVVKVLRRVGARHVMVVDRFAREIEALAKINHPGVVGILDYGTAPDGHQFLVMNFVDGVTLRTRLNEEPIMALEQASAIIRQIAEALDAAHDRGVLHRDLKPANIMLWRAGASDERVVIIDFGVSRVLHDIDSVSSGTVIAGTPEYMAPEQLIGQPSKASDTFALGIIAFQMLSGEKLERDGLPEKLGSDARRRLRFHRPDIGHEIGAAIERSLAVRPEDRQKTATDFARVFTRPQDIDRAGTTWQRAVALAFFVAIIGLTGWLATRTPTAPPEPPPVIVESTRTLSYEILAQRFQGKELDGEPFRPPEDYRYSDSVGIRFRFSSAEQGYLYIFNESRQATRVGSSWSLLYPGAVEGSGTVRAPVPTTVEIPSADHWIRFDQEAGIERVWLVWTTQIFERLEAFTRFGNRDDKGAIPLAEAVRLHEILSEYQGSWGVDEVARGATGVTLRAATENIVKVITLEHRATDLEEDTP
jgi:serine/threonine protein kinase